jgi:histidine triad (HIT) family protein
MSCLFCKIVAGEIPAKRLYEDDTLLAFADVHPQAPVHLLVIPKQHLGSLADAGPEHETLLGHLLLQAATIARDAGLTNGYRTVINTGDDGGQTVGHLHLHLLGGRSMHWPPG